MRRRSRDSEDEDDPSLYRPCRRRRSCDDEEDEDDPSRYSLFVRRRSREDENDEDEDEKIVEVEDDNVEAMQIAQNLAGEVMLQQRQDELGLDRQADLDMEDL